MREHFTYRAARRNMVIRAQRYTWGDVWANQANTHAKIMERRKRCTDAIIVVGKAMATRFTNKPVHPLVALREYWATVSCKLRERRRMLKLVEVDLRSARA